MRILFVATIIAIASLTPFKGHAQSPCGAFSCDYYRYMDNRQREWDEALQEQRMREQQLMIDRQLAEQRRQLEELRSDQERQLGGLRSERQLQELQLDEVRRYRSLPDDDD